MTTEVALDQWLISNQFTDANIDSTVQALSIPAKTLVVEVMILIETGFDNTPTIDVGDGNDADGWVDNADVTEGSTGTYQGTAANTASYSDTGVYYTAADTLDVTLASSGLAPTTGAGRLLARVIDLNETL